MDMPVTRRGGDSVARRLNTIVCRGMRDVICPNGQKQKRNHDCRYYAFQKRHVWNLGERLSCFNAGLDDRRKIGFQRYTRQSTHAD